MATPRVARSYGFVPGETDEYEITLPFLVRRDGSFTGFKGYFLADLSPTVVMDISGDDILGGTASDSWKHCYLPVDQPIPVRPGDRITLTFSRTPGAGSFGQYYRWRGTVYRGPSVLGRFDQRSGASPVRNRYTGEQQSSGS